jgi:hypothetical protein
VILLNYAHPITAAQLAQVAALAGAAPEVRDMVVQVDRARPLAEVAVELADAAGLSGVQWQSVALLVNPPSLAPVALALLAELHGRCGYFVPILNIRPVEGAPHQGYEVAEIIALQRLRDAARERRYPAPGQ